MRRVPEYAGGHHEKMDETGYPNKLRGDQMSLPACIMAIADIFEALTAADRPYKKAKTLSDSMKILYFMKKDKHVDADLFELFLSSISSSISTAKNTARPATGFATTPGAGHLVVALSVMRALCANPRRG